MIFVTNDAFSELVWSPRQGLSIRCAVGSIAETKSSFFWGAGLADMVLSPPHTAGPGTGHGNFAAPPYEAGDKTASLSQSGSCDSINTSSRMNCVQDDTAVDRAPESNPQDNVLPDSDGEKLECVAENDLPPSEQLRLEVCEISKAAPIRALALERKGKEKAVSDDVVKKRATSQDDDDSYESIESCNSAKRVSGGKKRVRSFEEKLIEGSKRLKMRVHETPGSSSFNRSNSSFANWISTMVKGSSRPDEGGDPSLALPSPVNEAKASGASTMGFKSHFQSIYRPVPKAQDARLVCADSNQETEANRVRDDLLAIKENTGKSLNQSLPGAAKDSLLHSTGLKGKVACDPLDSKPEASSKSFWLRIDSSETKEVGSSRSLIAGKKATNIFGKTSSDLPSAAVKKDDNFGGFFMNHFCPKSPKPVHDSQRKIAEEPMNPAFKKLQHNHPLDAEATSANPIGVEDISQRFTGSEAMASVFAKRLDALKNILRSDLTDKPASSATATCLFCGISGHDLRHCPRVTDTEVDQLLRNLAAYGGRVDSPCLCIRCFQLNHWASVCPNAPSRKKNKGLGRTARASTGVCTDLYASLEMKESAAFSMKVSSNLESVNASELAGFPFPCGSLANPAFLMPKGIFDAVQSLRLSRNDIMKWMSSIFSTPLDGYYLRLRRKVGEGLGVTQYHVACICGSQDPSSKGPISVMVDGVRCSVESQYISNQQFLEDELKTWWSATLRGDAKIPSEDELRSKVEERRRLGI